MASGQINEHQYEEKFKQLGDDWGKVLDTVNDEMLAKAFNGLDSLAEGIGDKTYSSVESAIEDIITNDMGISPDGANKKLFQTLKQAFMTAAYSGFSSGINTIVKELEGRKATALVNSG